MNFPHFLTILTLSLLLAAAVYAQGPLTIQNSGFETGDLSGWSIWPTSGTHQSVTTGNAHDGSNALNMTGASAAVYQTLPPPTPGDVYYAKGFVLNPPANPMAASQEIRIEITFFDENWTQLLQEFSPSLLSDAATDQWFELSIAGLCPVGTAYMNMGFNWIGTGETSTPGSALCDDLKAHHLVIPAENTNLGFEENELIWDENQEDWENWWCWAYEPYDIPTEIVTDYSRSGERSVMLLAQDWVTWGDPWGWGGYWDFTGQDISGPLDEGIPIYVGAWLMTPGDYMLWGTVDGCVKIDFKDLSGNNIEAHRPESTVRVDQSSTPDEWIWAQVWGEAPPNCSRAACNIVLSQYGEAEGVLVGDDVVIASGVYDVTRVPKNHKNPDFIQLLQNYPNPFNPATEILYSIDKKQHVRLSVFNILGERIAVPVDGVRNAGDHKIRFDGSNLSSGIYVCLLETENQAMTARMLLIR
ncbi:T9SS type A sorting domain-containing protein [candidate division KSB1 bacterium]|nr:T9SS type A sorting domain-containing protein [candidate division KSB1 bacterium]